MKKCSIKQLNSSRSLPNKKWALFEDSTIDQPIYWLTNFVKNTKINNKLIKKFLGKCENSSEKIKKVKYIYNIYKYLIKNLHIIHKHIIFYRMAYKKSYELIADIENMIITINMTLTINPMFCRFNIQMKILRQIQSIRTIFWCVFFL